MKYCVALLIMVIGVIGFTTLPRLMENQSNPGYSDTSRKNYLALGDSYTIGQSVLLSENFPAALTALLKQSGGDFNEPEIRAMTGWTTTDLLRSLQSNSPALQKYDLVTLMIGVNNQYRGGSLKVYGEEFQILLEKAIKYAGDKRKLIVLSIPDYSVTPFAAGTDRGITTKEINRFNATQKKIAQQYAVKFIDITEISRRGKKDQLLQAPDGLHPSAKQYRLWATKILPEAKK